MAGSAQPSRADERPEPIRILVIDDHPVFRLGLTSLLAAQPDMAIVCETPSIAEARRAVASLHPDVALVDVSLGESDGIDLVRWIRDNHPRTVSLVLSMHDEAVLAPSALSAGAFGYVSKEWDLSRLLVAIRAVHAKEVHVSSAVVQSMLRRATGRLEPDGVDSLSNREKQVFRLLGEGRGPTEIARVLHISVKTVEAHQSRIRRKLGVTSALQVRQRAALWVAARSGC